MAEEYNEITWIGDGVHCRFVVQNKRDLENQAEESQQRRNFHSHKAQMQKKSAVNTLVI
jgi:hypothetical protein